MKKSGKIRLLTILVTIIYVIEYHYVYKNFIYAYFSYDNLRYHDITDIQFFVLVLQTIFPLIFFKGSINLASLFSFMTYLFVYIPFVDSLYVSVPYTVSFGYSIVFLICMCMIFVSDKWYLGKKMFTKNKKVLSFHIFEIIVACLILISVLANINNMSFVNFLAADNDLYEKRALYHSSAIAGIIFYFVGWLSHFLLPFMAIVYYASKNYIKLGTVIFASVLMYMINMQKASLVIPVVATLGYVYFSKWKTRSILYLPILSVLIVGSLSWLLFVNLSNPIYLGLSVLFILRTQCIEGMQLDRYMDFFENNNNPVTHYGHIGIIDKLTGIYPYKESIGQMVAGNGSNSNATFWLMDGVAAEGVLGVFFITIVFIIVKCLINSIGLRYPFVICFFSLIYVIAAFLNTSLFTTILTGGLLIAYITYAYVKIDPFEKYLN